MMGRKPKQTLTNANKSSKINKKAKITKSEINKVSSGILTDHPNLKADGTRYTYEYGNKFYIFSVRAPGSYNFHNSLTITPENKTIIDNMRKILNGKN